MQVQQFERVNDILTKGTKVESTAHWKARRTRFLKAIAATCDSVERLDEKKYRFQHFVVGGDNPVVLDEIDFWMYAGGLPEWMEGMNVGEMRFPHACPA